MLLALFLHLYQPPTQFAKVLESITNASYRRVLNSIRRHPSAKVTINISGSLTEQLGRVSDLRSVLDDLADLVEKGQVELTGSAAYHPLLTELPRGEIRRQILLNDEINRRYFGDAYCPRGFFPPEMAWSRRVAEVVDDLGFGWVILDPSALPSAGSARYQLSNFKIKGMDLRIFFRNSDLSIKVAFSQIRTVEELKKEIYKLPTTSYTLILAMDGETFGHHRPEQLRFLEELFSVGVDPCVDPRKGRTHGFAPTLVTVSELQKILSEPIETEIRTSSWGPWERWKNPKNPIHQLQWQLFHLAIRTVQSSKHQIPSTKLQTNSKQEDRFEHWNLRFGISGRRREGLTSNQKKWLRARQMLDKAIHSDQFWWASAQPHWHYQMVERGARMLRDVVLTVPDAPGVSRRRARELYDKIISTGLKLHGECVIE